MPCSALFEEWKKILEKSSKKGLTKEAAYDIIGKRW